MLSWALDYQLSSIAPKKVAPHRRPDYYQTVKSSKQLLLQLNLPQSCTEVSIILQVVV